MPALVAGDLLKVWIKGTLFDQLIITTFAYKVTIDSTENNVITACSNFAADWKAGAVSPFLAFLACCSPEYNADYVYCQKISPTRYVPGFNNVNLPGTNANATNSTNQAAVVTRGTQLAGRAQIGSVHIPGLADANMLNGKCTAAFRTLMGTFGSKMLNDFASITDATLVTEPVLLHYNRTTKVYTGTRLFRTLSQETARVMRRRTIGVGK